MATRNGKLSARSTSALDAMTMAARVGLVALVLSVMSAAPATTVLAQSTAPGGFLETADSTSVRLPVTVTLPSRGKFTFPAPYNTTGIRLTNASDCGGADCVDYVGYSYWRNMNNHVGSDTMYILVGLDRNRGGTGPTLISYNKVTDTAQNLGALFDASSPLGWATGEQWYFSATQPTKLYVWAVGTPFYRYDVLTHQLETVFDVTTQFGANRYIWQLHSSNDDNVHSGTLRDSSTYAMLGCFAYSETTHQFSYYQAKGNFDECQVDKSGQWLLVKENVDGQYGEDNVIINLQTGTATTFLDQAGAAGHSDNGFGYMVAADNWNNLPGVIRTWTFGQPFPSSEPGTGVLPQGQIVYHTTDWSADLGHLSHANAKSGTPLSQQYACGGGASRLSLPRNNEIVCFPLDGSLRVLVVAPVMTKLDASGGGSDDYSKMPKGNLDVAGQYFIWTSNAGSSRLDVFIVKVPSQLLTGAVSGDTTPPTVSIAAPSGGATVSSSTTVAANASDNVGVAGVQFKLNGANLGAEVTTTPYSVPWNTASVVNGSYTLTAVARDAAGNTAISAGVTVTVANLIADTTAPTVSITAPGPGLTVTGTTQVSASASDDVGVAGVQFKLNGANLGAEVTTAPYSVPWNTASVANGSYTLTAMARDAAGNTATSAGVTVTVANTTGGGRAAGGTLPGVILPVTWTSLVNVTASGNSLQKTSGCDGCADAGAAALQMIGSAGGYVEFTASEIPTLRYIGLKYFTFTPSPINALRYAGLDDFVGTSTGIDYAIRLQSGNAEVRESNAYRTDTPFAPGDVFRISVESAVVKYYKNGQLFYQSGLALSYPLLVATSLEDLGATITNVLLFQAR